MVEDPWMRREPEFGPSPIDELLTEQVRYYRARAPEYDETSRPDGDPFADITARATADLVALGPIGLAVELGAGTGQFTPAVASMADRVIAVDTSPEVLALNAEKVPAANVERVVGDAFTFEPATRADLVMFGFLLSHIPRDRLAAFWESVGRMLSPHGSVFVIDEAPHGVWSEERDAADDVVVRTLLDGSRYRVVKVLWDPVVLAARLRELRWRAALQRRDPFFWGTVERLR
jgi:SAM-dependent methyltransferase